MNVKTLWVAAFFVAACGIGSVVVGNSQPISGTRPSRAALVIGNAAYKGKPLRNPTHDAADISARLRELGFRVETLIDGDRRQMDAVMGSFLGGLHSGDVAVFYYSGHGVQVDGENYLIPVDFDGQSETDIRYKAQPVSLFQERIEKTGARLNVIVLDACRDNPFRGTGRDLTNGLASMNPGRGTFVAFATAPGRTASDNQAERNGLFTKYLLEALRRPGLGLDAVFNYVREKVDSSSGGRQLPWALSGVIGDYVFVPGTPASEPVGGQVTTSEARKPGDAHLDRADGQVYVWIPPGSFDMGCSPGDSQCEDDEAPAHRVTIARGFWLGQTEVTVAAWKQYRAASGKPRLPSADLLGGNAWNENSGNDRNPAVFVTWDEASEFCRFAGGRLPTEAEWEYAARAGTAAARYGDVAAIAWYGDNSGRTALDADNLWFSNPGRYATALRENGAAARPAGSKLPNAWNVYDTLGGVWEWVVDWYVADYYDLKSGTNPTGPSSGKYRGLRGGSWFAGARSVRASARRGYSPLVRSSDVGCRCVRDVNP